MKVLVVHNSYREPGGGDLVVRRESELLRASGHQVVTYFRHNHEIEDGSLVKKITTGYKTVWAGDSYREIATVLKKEKPDVAHFHNTLPLISPSAYYACKRAQVPVVQTLHNYRLLCPVGTLFRDGNLCKECVSHGLWRGVKHGCYRDSRLGTATIAAMLGTHRALGTWNKAVCCYIAISEFLRNQIMAAGLLGDRVFVKPNFVEPDPHQRSGPGEYAIFVGRLSAEKGLRTMVAAWADLRTRIPLLVVGDGPMRAELEGEVIRRGLVDIKFEGRLPQGKTLALMKGARFLVFPSEWHEPFGMTIVEAFACGVPVVCSPVGAMAELVADGHTGIHYSPGNLRDFTAKLEWAWAHTQEMEEMGHTARAEYKTKYTAAENYRILMMVYQSVLQDREPSQRQRINLGIGQSGLGGSRPLLTRCTS